MPGKQSDKGSSSKTGLPSIENYIKKILLVSDNDAYNRLYEFVGREEINEKLKKYKLNGTRIIGRLAIGDSGETQNIPTLLIFTRVANWFIINRRNMMPKITPCTRII